MAIDLQCQTCQTDDHVELAELLTGTQRRLRCASCGSEWLRGEPEVKRKPLPTLDEVRRRFPKPGDVDPGRLERVLELKAQFLATDPEPQPNVAPFWAKYQHAFSQSGLAVVEPQVLKDFANSNVGANPGNMSVFNDAWNEMGAKAGAAQVREAVDYLLRGTSPDSLEDRLTVLISDSKAIGMKGFKEWLLTKVLCIVYPDRYLTILKYTGVAGKREIARSVWGLDLPDPERVTWTIGRLVLWSNDLLVALLGDGFHHQQHAAEFLWRVKDQV